MIQTLGNAFKIGELRNRILFTFGAVLVFRLGCQIPTPGVDPTELAKFFAAQSNTVLGFFNLFSGGALSKFSVFALGIAPYINASIIMQLLVYVIPTLEHLAKEEGEEGRKKINQYTRYGTVGIGALQALGLAYWLENASGQMGGGLVYHHGWTFRITAVITLTAGTAFIMWLGEQMTAKGIGNGISLLITAGIVAGLPSAVAHSWVTFRIGDFDPAGILQLLAVLAIVVVTTAAVVAIQDAVRKVPVQHAKRVVGRRVYGGANTHIPLRVNQAGVIPVIFASSVLMFPTLILSWFSNLRGGGAANDWVTSLIGMLRWGEPLYLFLESLMIIFFTYFYTAILLNPKEMADNLKKYGGFIPGIRAGRRTADYIDRILNRVTLCGALFLAAISVLPQLLYKYLNVPFYFGGTALLIVVGVVLDTVRQMESHMVTRHYQGFMRRS
ncbi:MAG: preprotein translocase subunit SecY [Candidatus Riflebacteria bacterium]|nr:preprotein translocase subunit SecY [Candidatus Riflebacteria bacterium]